MREFDRAELEQFDGKDGKPAYILHRGRVFDVSASKLWRGGSHMRRHHAGRDLTADFQAAPHGEEVLGRYPQVGILRQKEAETRPGSRWLSFLLERYPMLRRHPHPMTVHFPIAFLTAVPTFTVLSLLTGIEGLETTAFHCLGAGLLFLPVVMVTGIFSWWLNYQARPVKAIGIKLAASLVLLVLALISFVGRSSGGETLASLGPGAVYYVLGVLAFVPLVVTIGWYGAGLTFPTE